MSLVQVHQEALEWSDHFADAPRSSDQWASSDRGWLFGLGRVHGRDPCLGFYLDYGPDHYRSPHQYCRGACSCPESQPGNVLAVVVYVSTDQDTGLSLQTQESHWWPTAADAKTWVEEKAQAFHKGNQ